jgi:tripartite-type tricarboxylate transporter receptor subunit TctC
MFKLVSAAAIAAISLIPSATAQEKWPTRQVTIIAPFTAGGTADMFARTFATAMQAKYGAPFIVENRPGAGGNTGANAVARAPKDGYTLLLGTVSTHAINPFIYKAMPHDTEKDFQPVSLIARLPNMLAVSKQLPVKSVAELVEHLKKNPGKLNYASSGVGTSIHLAGELFQIATGTKMTHVPYRSSGEVMNNLVGGHVDLAFDNITSALPQARADKVTGLAVTSLQPSPTAPEYPPVAATLPGFEATSWHGLFAPAGTPRPIVDLLAAEVKAVFTGPDLQKTLTEIGAVPSPMTPDQFVEFISAERKKWKAVIDAAGMQPQ